MNDWPDVRKYDQVDWHIDGAIQARQPEENAGAHIGLYLGWLIRHDMHNPEFFPDAWVEAIKSGEMTGTEALDYIDGKLTSEDMTAEGAAFTDWYYQLYLGDFERQFARKREYSVVDDRWAQDRIEPDIDRRYADWIKFERPKPTKATIKADLQTPEPYMIELPPREEWDRFSAESRSMLEAELAKAAERGIRVTLGPGAADMPHESRELEALIPHDLGEKLRTVSSVSATHWRNGVLNRALKRLGVRPKDAFVANAFWDGMSVNLHAVPGVESRRLDEEFAFVWATPRGVRPEEPREIGDRRVHWSKGDAWVQAWWARDGLVVFATAQAEARLAEIVGRLP